MGSTLSTRFEWTSPASTDAATASDEGSQLKISVRNQEVLQDVIKTLDHICREHPMEAKTVFHKPLEWVTTLRPPMFNGSKFNTDGNTKTGSVVASTDLYDDGKPFFELLQQQSTSAATTKYVARASSLEYLNRVLQLLRDQQLKELQTIIQEKRDPIRIIFGVSGENALVDAFEACNNQQDQRKREQYNRLYKLLLIVNGWDLKLMKSTVQDLQREKTLDIQKVSEELQMLQAFCGTDRERPLLSINWESDYSFANGCRSPPWRQVYGELCYLDVQPFDREKFIITAAKRGYFINKGYVADEKGQQRLDYEAVSDVYPTLVDLLRAQSKHFNEKIDNQQFAAVGELDLASASSTEGIQQAPIAKAATEDEDMTSYEDHDRRKPNGAHRQQHQQPSKKSSSPSKRNTKPRTSTEPSLKWKALGPTVDGRKSIVKSAGTTRPSMMGGSTGSGARKTATNRRWDEEDAFSATDDEDTDDEVQEKRQEMSELPAEYYQIQKLVKYLRAGNQTATIIAICSLRDFDLTNEFNQIAIRDVGGLETLVNLLDTDDPKCKIGALKILKDISQNVTIRSAIADLDGMNPLVELLQDNDKELRRLAAETIAHCAKNARNRRSIRRYGGIRKLVRLLKAKPGSEDERVAIGGALALATCSKSARSKEAIRAAGCIPLLANLLESRNEELLIPVVGILQECASDEAYRSAIRSAGMIRFLVEGLASKNQALQTHCASAIFKCAEEEETRNLVRQHNGLTYLVNLLDNTANKELLAAATGAVWKCARNTENVLALNKLNTIKKLVGLMENQPEDVLVNAVGALGACAQTVEGRQAIRESNGITPLVNLLTGTNQALLVNVTTAVGACALDSDSMAIIDRLDGVRLLWSLLKSSNPQVQASAAWAISPCIEHAKDAGEMVRSFVGGLELIVSLLKSDSTDVLASVCSAIANIAKDEENLAVITDHGVVPMLAKLTHTRNDKLRRHLAEAIARCCHWGNNRVAFGTSGAVAPLVKYLRSVDEEVHRSTARALHQLSMDPDNCITMHENGVVELLLGMVGSADKNLQEAAAGTIGNIRRLALASEKAAMT
ncbi:armadillo-type protein [Gaertneriomyces semiglobifer]|nr:armadillo-type protein [Gaertneriomyces semiglobifer]